MSQQGVASLVTPLPYGIAARHVDEAPSRGGRTLLQLLVLGIPIGLAMFGLLGGGSPSTVRAESPGAAVAVEAPGVLRSGNWFESRVIVEARTDISDLTIAIDQSLWHRLSIDTLVPDASAARGVGGHFAYGFGPLRRGERFVLKLDGQMHPDWLRVLRGRISVLDGDRPIVAASISQLVLP